MTAQSSLELDGNFGIHPFAELAAEISQARLTGSLRLSCDDRKSVVYFNSGRLAFAVSNARSSRLFEIMLGRGTLTKDEVTKIPNFSNDLEFSDHLLTEGTISSDERNRLFVDQIEAILVDILTWESGAWNFSPLTRLREGLVFQPASERLLVDYGRCLASNVILNRFRSLEEPFEPADMRTSSFNLNQNEISVLSKFGGAPKTPAEIINETGLPHSEVVPAMYVLWLGGLLTRKSQNPAFSPMVVARMQDAHIDLKREATPMASQTAAALAAANAAAVNNSDSSEPVKQPEVEISLDDYLLRVEEAQTFYDLLGVDVEATVADIKRAYFSLARMFHPDHYHQADGDLLRRVQVAFTELAQAHETLKNEASRESYDFKIRKELASREKLKAVGGTYDELNRRMQQGAEAFDRGYDLLMDGSPEAAVPFMARAVHFDPKNADYHAYYGKALSAEDKNRHKAEAELQSAVKLDPRNPTYRVLLAEFFIQVKLAKRAEGELNRLLAIFPSNREARALLDSLHK